MSYPSFKTDLLKLGSYDLFFGTGYIILNILYACLGHFIYSYFSIKLPFEFLLWGSLAFLLLYLVGKPLATITIRWEKRRLILLEAGIVL